MILKKYLDILFNKYSISNTFLKFISKKKIKNKKKGR